MGIFLSRTIFLILLKFVKRYSKNEFAKIVIYFDISLIFCFYLQISVL